VNPSTCKLERRGTFDGYEVAGWQRSADASWKVKVWLAGCPRDWFGYTVTAGMFKLKMYAHAQREAVMRAIGEWEADLMDPDPLTTRGAKPIAILPAPACIVDLLP
jgi:hypothetical protein